MAVGERAVALHPAVHPSAPGSGVCRALDAVPGKILIQAWPNMAASHMAMRWDVLCPLDRAGPTDRGSQHHRGIGAHQSCPGAVSWRRTLDPADAERYRDQAWWRNRSLLHDFLATTER